MPNQDLSMNLAARLVGRGLEYRDKEVFIKGEDFLIGRSVECHLMLNENMVSARHAKILKSGDRYELQDLNSTNGTFINDEKIDKKVLRPGDRVRFGPVEFEFLRPIDVSRTIMATPEEMARIIKSAEAAAHAPAYAIPPTPSPAPSPMPSPAPYPAPVAAAKAAPIPASQAGGSLLGGLILGVFCGLILVYGLSLMAGLYQLNKVGGLTFDAVLNYLKSWAVGLPSMHTHIGWKMIGIKTVPGIIVLLGIFLGPLLGGMIAQRRSGRSRPAAAIGFSVLYCAVILAIQLAVAEFQFGAWPQFFPSLVPSLGAWGNFIAGLVYFFFVVLILSLGGTLLARRES